ncbi:MAG TPA: DNA polymerase III subunit delta [Candidatus Eremiobacteraceae bacterium]|nr:DNA polymerase III subunit delta [Candidatus Eremiobacteraceae bacterium]
MPRLSLDQFKQRLQKAKPIPALLLLGNEPYLRDSCRAELIDKYVPEAARAWAVSRFSADRGELQAALDQCQTLPMLSTQQVVFLEDAETLEKLGDKAREDAIESLDAYLQDPAPFTVLVIEAEKLDMRMLLGKKLAELALVVEVTLGERVEDRVAAAEGLAKALAKEQGVTFETGAAEDLAEFVSGDLMRLKTELDKLATFAAQRKMIRREDVSALVISEKTTTIWQVADLLASHQPRKALEFIDCLLREGEEPVMMVGAMAWMYRKLVEASELRGITGGWQAARALGMRPEQAELAVRCARRIPRDRLLDGVRALQEADDRLKGGVKDVRAIMEFLVWRLSGERAASAS